VPSGELSNREAASTGTVAGSDSPRNPVVSDGGTGPFTDAQIREISRACATASAETGLHFSVYIGAVDADVRDHAERLHAALGPLAARAVLVAVAPGDRQLEIVTGRESARRLSDRACALAALSMTTAFSGGDLVGGVVTGLRMLSEATSR
jgi:uncharacterized membrane protein YgcG